MRRLGAIALLALLTVACVVEPRPPRGWERVYPAFTAPVHALIRDPVDPWVIYAGCGWQAMSSSRQIGGILRSADRGETWIPADRGLPPGVEVLSLGIAPARFVDESPALLAGTQSAGLFSSTDGGTTWRPLADVEGDGGSDGPDWSQTPVQAILGLTAEPPAVAVGTPGLGVLVSADGGRTWDRRNEGLHNLTIQGLLAAPDGTLVAATWYGGVYRSADLGAHWRSLDPEVERLAVTAAAIGPGETLWLGLQNAGLLARARDGEPFVPQGSDLLETVGILSVEVTTDRVVVGTSGQGAAVGRVGGRFTRVIEGLENTTVAAVLVDPTDPREIVLGTWGGLYRAVPPRSYLPAIVLGSVVGLGLIATLATAWHRSVGAEARRLFHDIGRLQPTEIANFLDRRLSRFPAVRSQAILERLARRLDRAETSRAHFSDVVRITAPLVGLLSEAETVTADRRRALASVLEARANALDVMALRIGGPEAASVADLAARQDRLVAAILRCDTPGQLATLRGEVRAVTDRSSAAELSIFFHSEFLGDLSNILEALERLDRVPGTEDRVLFLGRALTQVLGAQKRLQAYFQSRPSHGSALAAMLLESLRQLLATAMDDLQQRADLVMHLRSQVITARREAAVVLEIRNVGQGPAHNVKVELRSGGEQFVVTDRRQIVPSLLRQQSARLEFVIEPRVSDRVRLRFLVTYSDLKSPSQQLEFADVVELRQVDAARPFRPLRPNPYVVGRPLTETDVFIGRDELFERLEASLRGAYQDNVVVLIGQRRMGKTSILRRLPDRLGDDYVAVFIDLQGLLSSGEATFFREIVTTIGEELESQGIHVEPPTADELQTDPGHAFRRQYLKKVGSAIGDRRLLLLFDEFEVLEDRIRTGYLDRQILPYFRSLMQHERNVSFMFAGTHRLDELTGDYWSVLFNLAVYIDVGHLPADEVKELFLRPTREVFEIDPLAVEKIHLITGGHPHFSQLLARELVEYRNRRQLSYVTVQDVNLVADEVVEKGQLHISYLWDTSGRSERLLLLALKELLEREGTATLAGIHRYLQEHHIEPGDLPGGARRLIRREILADDAGLLSFRIGLLRLWMDVHHNLDSFVMSDSGSWAGN